MIDFQGRSCNIWDFEGVSISEEKAKQPRGESVSERTVELDEPVMDEQSQALQNAVERAERAEAELAKMKSKASHAPAKGATATHKDGAAAHPQASANHKDSSSTHGNTASTNSGDVKTARAQSSDSDRAETIAPKGTSSTAHADPTGKHLVEPGSMDASKQPAAQEPEGHAVGDPEAHGIEALREDAMMRHLLDSLDRGEDIGHYGRLTFAMISRHFLNDDEVLAEMTKDETCSEEDARQMLVQVEGRDYSPPRRERILEWNSEQEFPIIPDTHDPDCGNVYKSLRFPKQTYSHIGHYQEEKVSS